MLSRAIDNPQVVLGQPWTSRRSMHRLTRCVLTCSATWPPQPAPPVARTAGLDPGSPQMIKFIQQEASEKAQEIKLKADEEYNIEKLYMVEEEKQKIRQEYERKEKQVEVQKRMCAPPARPCGDVAAAARASHGSWLGCGVSPPHPFEGL